MGYINKNKFIQKSWLKLFSKNLLENFPIQKKIILSSNIKNNNIILEIDKNSILDLILYLRNHKSCQYKVLIDITAVDNLEFAKSSERFEVVYQLLSLSKNSRITVKCTTHELYPLESLTTLFSSANWYEREVWDMFGIFFTNHPDLRRILTDYGFVGHPLRRDFPLSGYSEVKYDEFKKRIVNQPVKLTQKFRTFDLTNSWNSLENINYNKL
jgi:NADH-quinone oxidoreductase subunit C